MSSLDDFDYDPTDHIFSFTSNSYELIPVISTKAEGVSYKVSSDAGMGVEKGYVSTDDLETELARLEKPRDQLFREWLGSAYRNNGSNLRVQVFTDFDGYTGHIGVSHFVDDTEVVEKSFSLEINADLEMRWDDARHFLSNSSGV